MDTNEELDNKIADIIRRVTRLEKLRYIQNQASEGKMTSFDQSDFEYEMGMLVDDHLEASLKNTKF